MYYWAEKHELIQVLMSLESNELLAVAVHVERFGAHYYMIQSTEHMYVNDNKSCSISIQMPLWSKRKAEVQWGKPVG